MNTVAPDPQVLTLGQARERVLGIQTKLHRWSTGDATTRFDDLFNLVVDPAFLVVAWDRVRSNTGARSAGVDGQTARTIETGRGVEAFLIDLRAEVKAGRYAPQPVREHLIPKSPGKVRRLGIPTVTAECPAFWRVFGCGADCSSVPCVVRPSAAGVVRQTSWA